MTRLLMVAMTAVLWGGGSASALGVSPMTSGTSPLSPEIRSLTTSGGIGGSIPQASFGAASTSMGTTSGMGTSSAGPSSSTLPFDGGTTAGIASGTCAGAAVSSLAGPAASASSPTGMGSMSTGGRIGLPLASTELRNAPMIALTDKRTPADIQALLAHVTASDACVLVSSGEGPSAVGGRLACVHSCDSRTATVDKLNLSRCDVMFFDLNDHEAAAIKGATATIKRFAPVIITALPAAAASDIIDALQALDYRLVDKVGGDYVYMKGEPI
jgi:hypothetical protein